MIQFLLIKNITNKVFDITQIVKTGATLSKTIGDLCYNFKFEIFEKSKVLIEGGDIIVVKIRNKEKFSGVIISTSDNSYKALDYGFYFNQNKETFQFEDIEASKAIAFLIKSIGGHLGTIETTNTMIDKLYFGQSLASILQEIIDNIFELEDKSYNFFYNQGKFHFTKSKKDKYKEGNYKPLKAIKSRLRDFEFNGLKYIDKPSRSTSIENLRNSVRVYEQKENDYIKDSEAKAENSIKKFGLMQEIIEIKENDKEVATKKAENILKQLNKVEERISFSVNFSNLEIDPFDILELNYEEYNIKGIFEVTSVSYNISNNIKLKLECERVS